MYSQKMDSSFSQTDLRAAIRSSCARFCAQCDASRAITSLGIPSCDRPETLGRALSSYVENTTSFERAVEFTVMDDSRYARTKARNREQIQSIQPRFGVSIRYATRERRAEFADELGRLTGIPNHVLRFALLGDDRVGLTYGSTRNALLLDSVGELTLQADDDTICRIATAPDAEAGMVLTSRSDANELWFFESFEDALAAGSPVDVDFFAVHEQLLGRAPAACIAEVEDAGEDLDFTTIDLPFLQNLQANIPHVAASFVGIAGDSGAPYPFRFLHDEKTFQRLVETEHAYRAGMATRQMIKTSRRKTISDGSNCMTTNIGLDSRMLLPPFMPVFSNEDGVFGSLLSAFFPGSFFGYLPYTVIHSPPVARPPSSASFRMRYLANGLMIWIIMSLRELLAGPDSSRNLESLGRCLQKLGRLPQDDFTEYVRTTARRVMQANVAHAKKLLNERRGAPAYWIDDVNAYLRSAKEAVVSPRFAIPSDLEGSEAERFKLFQEMIDRFGGLLVHWPAIVQGAKELREQGHRIAAQL